VVLGGCRERRAPAVLIIIFATTHGYSSPISLPHHHCIISTVIHPHCHSACCTVPCMLPLAMPYNSQPPLSKNTKKNVFNYILWLMELPMTEESEVTKYYNWFLDLTEPLLDLCMLEDKECNTLFWCSFHPDDHALLLYYFANYPHMPPGEYFHL
jgi:hypothetical protein